MIYTTIRIKEEVKKKLDELKVHPRETYEDILKRLIEFYESKNGKTNSA